MRIIVFCTADLRLGSGSEVRARLIASGLKESGNEVCTVSLSVPSVFARKGIESFVPKPGESWGNVLDRAAGTFRPDFIYGITEACADAVVYVAGKRSCRIAFDLHGIGVVEIIELGPGYGPRLPRLYRSARWLSDVRRADIITVANPTLVKVASLIYGGVSSVIGMTDLAHFHPQGLKERIGADASRTQVLFAGNYFKWQGVDLLIDAIRILARDKEPFEFTLMGSVGRSSDALRKWRIELPSDLVHFVDSVDYDVAPAYYRGADVLVIPRPFMLSTHLAFPQKLVDYMASGRTIVATDLAPHKWALKSPRAGILCPPTARGLADGIRATKDSILRELLGTNARKVAVEKFSHLHQANRICGLFYETIQSGSPLTTSGSPQNANEAPFRHC